ncbi:unnamed protein product, partial [marine sediment metagenome]
MNGDEKVKEKFFVKEEFIEYWAESFAEALKRHTTKIEWLERREIKLDTARTAWPVDMIPPEGFDSGNYIRVLSLDGTATLRLDTLGSHEFDLTIFTEFKQLFHKVLITNTAQAGKKLILALGRGDFSFPEATQKVQPADIQAQLRTVVADNITPLGANGLYESPAFDALNYSRITLLAFSDQASTANGVQVQQSIDGEDDHWDYSTNYTLAAGVPVAATIELVARYV